MWYSQNAYQTEQLLLKKYFDSMFSLESDEMTALWPNDSFTFTFYVVFSNSMPNGTTFVKEIFWIEVQVKKVTKWLLCDQITA